MLGLVPGMMVTLYLRLHFPEAVIIRLVFRILISHIESR